MAEQLERPFDYVAIDAAGRRVKGRLSARSDGQAFEQLKRDGLAPVRLRPSKDRAVQPTAGGLTDREAADFLSDLAALLGAGANIRNALSILGAKAGRPGVQALARRLAKDIGGGEALELAFSTAMGRKHSFVGALVAAGEAGGDLPGGLQRAADMLTSRIKLQDQLVSTLSYPFFVFLSTVMALGVILLFVTPSLAPLVDEAGGAPPLTLAIMLGLSSALRSHLAAIGIGLALIAVALAVAGRMGALREPAERLLLDGLGRRTTSGLVYGGFAIALGNMLSAGAPISDALRLANRTVVSAIARRRLDIVAQAVRQGDTLSTALGRVSGVPQTIVRLAGVGEASGGLGPMLVRGGRLEEEAAIRRIEGFSRILGPSLIVGLGGLIGVLMAGLLSGVSELGQAALQ